MLVRFATLLAAAAVGLLLWGPMPIDADAHRYADARTWLGIPNAANVLVNVPIFWLAVWGWCATRTSRWPHALRLPWQWFHFGVIATALTAAMYHAAPGDALFLAAHGCMAGAFVLLGCGMLAERVDARFGSFAVCAGVVATTLLVTSVMVLAKQRGSAVDLRLLALCEMAPVLLLLAGALRLPSAYTRASGWMLTLLLYASSNLFELADAALFRASGWISGHTLMHAALALVVGWMAYRAAASRATAGSGSDLPGASDTQRQTSLNTIG